MNRTSFESEIGRYHLEMGILICHSKNPKRTRENIAANAALVKELTGNKPVPLLIFLSPSPMPDKATRRYAASILPELYSAMAMVSKPGLSAFIMKVLFSLRKPPIPMKSFTNESEARAWLQRFIQ